MPLTPQAANRKDQSTARHGVTLQHRHFAFIAGVIARHPVAHERVTMYAAFVDACERSNPRFDRGRFRAACLID